MMRHIVSLLAGLLSAVSPAAAAERVLPVPRGVAGRAAVLSGLRQQAESLGRVRVIIGLKVPFAADWLAADPAVVSPSPDQRSAAQLTPSAARIHAPQASPPGDAGPSRCNSCSQRFDPGAKVTLTATAAARGVTPRLSGRQAT